MFCWCLVVVKIKQIAQFNSWRLDDTPKLTTLSRSDVNFNPSKTCWNQNTKPTHLVMASKSENLRSHLLLFSWCFIPISSKLSFTSSFAAVNCLNCRLRCWSTSMAMTNRRVKWSSPKLLLFSSTLWLFNIAMENNHL